ncbi:MAG TPA: SPW repeat protein [Candidatus Acidoferrum sp.]|nr:SPW repeat protein [Candidatus Acidoferrum sp.]
MRFLPTKIHGILDYVVGVALIFAPNIFMFEGGPMAAVWVPRIIGAVLIIYSIFTKYEWGLVKIIPMPYHLVIDFLASLFLALSPWLLGFSNEAMNVWIPHVAVGVVVILVVLVSQTQPGHMSAAPMLPTNPSQPPIPPAPKA